MFKTPLEELAVRKVLITVLSVLLLLPAWAAAQSPERAPVLLDTDLGTTADDAFALALLLASPELELRGVTTSGSDPQTRALMLCRFLTMTGRRQVPVAASADPQPDRPIKGLYQYYHHPDVLFNRTTRPAKESAVDFLYARLKAQPGKVTLLATGPLTNVARLFAAKPDAKTLVRRVIIADNGHDPKAAQAVRAAGVPLVIVPAELTKGLTLGPKALARIFAPTTALSLNVQALHQLDGRDSPALGPALAAALCVDDRFCAFKQSRHVRIALAVKRDEFVPWYVDRLASCVPPSTRPSRLVAAGGMPNRVHVAEDYDTDLERRWWMAGKAETTNLPPGSKRACRGVLTHDFDDLLGSSRMMYTAVIFNPVPGPPMGPNPRLRFRYWLRGTDTLRVQLYSLTNGYHRHLVLKGLPEGQWQDATVDMTQCRRPDGTGGPLSAGERIDDLQFYAAPTAELLIDDVFLYDAAPADEKRPFPRRVLFTGLFDSGKQGKEWPGTFAIVPNQGYFWHGARSVPAGLRLHLRGERTLGAATHLSFRYHLTGADGLDVALVNERAKTNHRATLKGLAQAKWAEAGVAFPTAKASDRVDEIVFALPPGAELTVDDVLLYEPGE